MERRGTKKRIGTVQTRRGLTKKRSQASAREGKLEIERKVKQKNVNQKGGQRVEKPGG